MIADNAVGEQKVPSFRRSPGGGTGRLCHERVFGIAGPATGAEAGIAVTMLSDFSSSGLKTKSVSVAQEER